MDRATVGDRAQGRMSERGLANSNGIFCPGAPPVAIGQTTAGICTGSTKARPRSTPTET